MMLAGSQKLREGIDIQPEIRARMETQLLAFEI